MKRSSQVALLLMGVTGVGASSYALTPRSNCPPPTVTGTAVPGQPAAAPCQPGRSHFTSHGSGGYWSRPIFSGSTPSGGHTSAPSGRGGFGSTGAAHSSGS